MELIQDITTYCLEHSAEAEACDLLMEIEKIDIIENLVSKDTHERVCLYLTRFKVHTHTHTHTAIGRVIFHQCSSLFCACVPSCVKYVPEPEDSILLNTALRIYRQFDQYPHALRLAMMLNNPALIREIFLDCPDRWVGVARSRVGVARKCLLNCYLNFELQAYS